MMRKGRKYATLSRSAMVGASRAPSLARVEHAPVNILILNSNLKVDSVCQNIYLGNLELCCEP